MNYNDLPDKELVEKVINKDIVAFKILFDRYSKKIYNLIYYMIYNKEDSEDLTQDTFVKAYTSIKTLKKKERFGNWLYHIAINNCRNYLKKYLKFETVELDLSLPDPKEISVDSIYNDQLQKHLEMALKSLGHKYREVVILHHIKELNLNEISEILKIPVGTIKSRLARAREHLKSILKNYILEGELV